MNRENPEWSSGESTTFKVSVDEHLDNSLISKLKSTVRQFDKELTEVDAGEPEALLAHWLY